MSANLFRNIQNFSCTRVQFNPQLLYASECYSLSRMDVRALEAFNKKTTKWMCYLDSYKDRLSHLQILPLTYFMEMKENILLSGIVTHKYDVNFDSNIVMEYGRNEIQFYLPQISCELLRDNFFYRACYRANVLSKLLNITDNENIKKKLLTQMWKKFVEQYQENNICSWYFV